MPTSPGKKREIYWWFTQDLHKDYHCSLKNPLTQLNTKHGFYSLFLGRRKHPQISSRSGPDSALTRLSVDRPINRFKYSRSLKTSLLFVWSKRASGRLVGRPSKTHFSLFWDGRWESCSFSSRPSSINRVVDRINSCVCRVRLGAPSQNTSLFGGVAQILIYPRSSRCLADVELFIRPKFQQSPSNKESPCKLWKYT